MMVPAGRCRGLRVRECPVPAVLEWGDAEVSALISRDVEATGPLSVAARPGTGVLSTGCGRWGRLGSLPGLSSLQALS